MKICKISFSSGKVSENEDRLRKNTITSTVIAKQLRQIYLSMGKFIGCSEGAKNKETKN